MRLDSRPGTYALIVCSAVRRQVQIGKLGRLDVVPGFYVYAGSAFGPGGLAARISRHRRKTKTRRWHIDYLTAILPVEEVWYTLDAIRRECHWADVLSQMRGAEVPAAGFGSSDCACRTHLWFFPIRPSRRTFCRRLTDSIPDHDRVYRVGC